jgi:hypothetical protein
MPTKAEIDEEAWASLDIETSRPFFKRPLAASL